MPGSVLCVGALTLDTIYKVDTLPIAAGKIVASSVVVNAAGMAASASIAIARLGASVDLLASVGNDAAGQQLLQSIAAAGIGTALVRTVDGVASATATIVTDAVGERLVFVHYPADLLSPPITSVPVSNYRVVLADIRWPEAAAQTIGAARACGIPTIVDLDTAPVSVLRRLAPLADHVVASASGAMLATGAPSPEEALPILAHLNRGFAAITLGHEGCIWTDGIGAPVRHTAAPRIAPVDTNAAGDVFHGAFALGLAEGIPREDIIRFASAAAAIKCTRLGGALGTPTRDQLRDWRDDAGMRWTS